MPPSSITGGCLCGGVRYEVNFAVDHDFKTNVSIHNLRRQYHVTLTSQSHNCQCTQCRKQAGSLVIHWHTVTGPELKWTSTSTLGNYSHTAGVHRFICTKCGGTLAWQDEKDGGDIEFTVGTVDEKYLIGDRTGDGNGKALAEGYGSILADPSGRQCWSSKMIKGVTDNLPGPKE